MAESTEYLLGIDGGATHVRVALADQTGRVRGFGVAGAASFSSSQLDAVRTHVEAAARRACQQADIERPAVAAFWGLAGIVTQTDRDDVARLAHELRSVQHVNVEVDHDIRTALAGGLDGRPGIALISGTGSSCYGRNATGQCWQAGGWEHLIDDSGAAYDIALRGLTAAARGVDGRGQTTALTDALFDAINIRQLPEIIRRLHVTGLDDSGAPCTKEQLARLAPVVFKVAEAGDNAACRILDDAAEELTLMVAAVARNLDWSATPIEVITAGSVARNPAMAARLQSRIARLEPAATLVEAHLSPVGGALVLAAQMAGLDLDAAWTARLGASLAEVTTASPAKGT